ncbi:MAG: aquaporin [Saprospiraceae bacterium]|nr:aquaporin [Saprospiraceae bacterium]
MKKYIAEFIGTYALVFFGTGAILVNDLTNGAITHSGICIVFGLIVTVMIYTFGPISGTHINPAVTIGFQISGCFDKKEVVPYIIAQIIGACGASLTLLLLFVEHGNLGATLPSGTILQSFILEIILTYFLMVVILFVSQNKDTAHFTAVAVGATVALEAWFAGPICGASMNPARSIGPALVNGNLEHLWIYIIAPVLGVILAAITFKLLKE